KYTILNSPNKRVSDVITKDELPELATVLADPVAVPSEKLLPFNLETLNPLFPKMLEIICKKRHVHTINDLTDYAVFKADMCKWKFEQGEKVDQISYPPIEEYLKIKNEYEAEKVRKSLNNFFAEKFSLTERPGMSHSRH